MHLRRPLSCLTLHISPIPVNICITLISLETTLTGLHFCCWQYGSICIQIFVVGSERHACNVIECIMAVQGHPRSLIFTPIESPLSTSYYWSIVTLIVSCTVFEILLHMSKNRFFALLILLSSPRSGGTPSEFLDETYPAETRGVGLLYDENCIILTSNAFDWSTRVTDRGKTELQWHIRAIAYMLSRVKMMEVEVDAPGNDLRSMNRAAAAAAAAPRCRQVHPCLERHRHTDARRSGKRVQRPKKR